MSLYVGVNGRPRKVSKLLTRRPNHTAIKEVKTAYAGGVNSSVNKVYSNFDIDKELANTNPVAALTSGKITKNDLGKTVYLSNSVTTCQEWKIADINHDGTSGTVDLISKYTLDYAGMELFILGDGSEVYETCMLRKYFNGTYIGSTLSYTIYDGFQTNVRNNMKDLAWYVNWHDTIDNINDTPHYDKVRLPSTIELGVKRALFFSSQGVDCGDANYQGTIYPIYGSEVKSANTLAIAHNTSGTAVPHVCRNHSSRMGIAMWPIINSTEGCNYMSNGTSSNYLSTYALGTIRF